MMKISHNRIINSCGLVVGYTKWLPHGAEPYKLLIPHYADWIAEMMTECRPKYNGNYLYDFFNNINFDKGTSANPDHIRNALLYEMKNILKIPQSDTRFTNKYGVTFNFEEWYINVCLYLHKILYKIHIMYIYIIQVTQETFHIIIRMNKKGCFRHHHSDCYYCRGNALFVVKQLREKYDFYNTPPIVTQTKKSPYQLLMKDNEFDWLRKNNQQTYKEMKNIINAVLQLDGTHDPKLVKILTDTKTKQKTIAENQCKWLVQHIFTSTHERWVPHMLSVCIFLITLLYYAT